MRYCADIEVTEWHTISFEADDADEAREVAGDPSVVDEQLDQPYDRAVIIHSIEPCP